MRLINADALKKSVLDLHDCYNGFSDTYDKACIIGVIDEEPTIEPEPHWIPCSERLPEDEKRVLCTVQSGEHFNIVTCIYIQRTRRWLPEAHGNHDNVLAWMPLPEPYRGEQDGSFDSHIS